MIVIVPSSLIFLEISLKLYTSEYFQMYVYTYIITHIPILGLGKNINWLDFRQLRSGFG